MLVCILFFIISISSISFLNSSNLTTSSSTLGSFKDCKPSWNFLIASIVCSDLRSTKLVKSISGSIFILLIASWISCIVAMIPVL